MKLPSVKPNSIPGYILLGLLFGLPYGLLKFKAALATALVMLSSGIVAMLFNKSEKFIFVVLGTVMLSMVLAFKYGALNEGFLDASPEELANLMSKMSEEKEKENETEGFSSLPSLSGLSPVIEGYEDVKKEKDETHAPATEKDELPMPFNRGEIPAQVKNGPHIDAGSTLMKAIKSLNPDQINAMTKDTQQLIETQKSLMGMLGTMKPMLNDGKQLMDTFQQMFPQ